MAFEMLFVILFLIIVVISWTIQIVNEWERGVVLTLGRYSRKAQPGVNIVIPLIETLIKVDTRITTIDIPKQEVMTKDNVPTSINAVVYMRVEDAEKAILKIKDYIYAVSQYSQTALRDVIGEISLDQLLTSREEIAEKIRKIVDEETAEWGIDITSIKLQDIELPADMKRAMARQAEAERERRATIILSEGEVIAAKNLKTAAEVLAENPVAVHLRTLQTLTDISSDPSVKMVIPLPVEILKYFYSSTKEEKEEKRKTKE
jgi:regulator of protease activity HflC (stomatin/prohibitin superfamily)